MALNAVVIGAGWAGEGHTTALRAAGVDVVAMCGRTPEPAYAMAKKLGIEEVRFDWRQALEEFKPDIVSIATPAGPHLEIAETAAALGCHLACDKPLGRDAAEARAMLLAVEKAGVKHTYATTSRYAAHFAYTRSLLASGLIGRVREIEYFLHANISALLPYSWLHSLEQGGGGLNNVFTHQLGQMLFMTDGGVLAAAGEARRLIDRAPVGPAIHDFRDIWSFVLSQEQAEASEWRKVDADFGHTVMLRLEMPESYVTSALFQASFMATSQQPNTVSFYGTEGTLQLSAVGASWEPSHIRHYRLEQETWQEMPVPEDFIDALPKVDDAVQRNWNVLFAEFIADIRGEGYAGYPTFRDGWVANEIIDIVRSGAGWVPLPEHPAELIGAR